MSDDDKKSEARPHYYTIVCETTNEYCYVEETYDDAGKMLSRTKKIDKKIKYPIALRSSDYKEVCDVFDRLCQTGETAVLTFHSPESNHNMVMRRCANGVIVDEK